MHAVCLAVSVLDLSGNVINTQRQFLKVQVLLCKWSEESDMSQTKESYKTKWTLSGEEYVGGGNFRSAHMGCL